MQKITFIPHLFFEMLQRYCRLVIFGTLGMPGHADQEQQHRPVGNNDFYLQTKNQLDPSIFLEVLYFKEYCNLIGQEHFGQ